MHEEEEHPFQHLLKAALGLSCPVLFVSLILFSSFVLFLAFPGFWNKSSCVFF